ncbi:hypothetical protein E1B28_013693 [Marasmius oreades]|uniref:Uncharacterized protein n=1 Tax=Marasmius oreades TaxID=181124 RepID=A0A9P7UMI6_9AGAR|nr:uncharacterized protein E1B28_013693 [Marasmius oreades]KAG7087752.1 hypothetical protein E1B28_013693 [Marasmius oreades]
MVVIPPGEPKESQKPQPPGSMALVALVTACTVCGLFILWRRADAVRAVVSHRLKTLRRPEGRIRLSEDDGLPAHEPIHDDADEDELDDSDDEPLTERPSPKDSPSATASNENRP